MRFATCVGAWCGALSAFVLPLTLRGTARAGSPPAAARPPAAAASNATDIVARVQAHYDDVKTLRASFTQTFVVKSSGTRTVRRGKISFARPGRFAFHYEAPAGDWVVGDAKRVIVFERATKQRFEIALRAAQQPAVFSFLLGKGGLEREFTLRVVDATGRKLSGGIVLEATPRVPTPAYARVGLFVDSTTGAVRRVLVLDANGNRNLFQFDDVKTNVPIPRGELQARPEAGSSVVTP